jgi:hypothetical protein
MYSKPTGAMLRLVALAVVVVFAGATFTCAAGEALASRHHHGHHHDRDAGNCCSSLKSLVPAGQQIVLNPNRTSWSAFTVIALLPVSSAITSTTGVILDHGPPGLSPPEFLLVGSRSPRSPPVLA